MASICASFLFAAPRQLLMSVYHGLHLLAVSARSGSLVQKTSAQAPAGLDARVCAQRFAHSLTGHLQAQS